MFMAGLRKSGCGSAALHLVYAVHKRIAKIMDSVHMEKAMRPHDHLTPAPEVPPVPGRSTYRHGDLRRALLDAGIELARSGGPDAVVLREATRRAGVVPNAA